MKAVRSLVVVTAVVLASISPAGAAATFDSTDAAACASSGAGLYDPPIGNIAHHNYCEDHEALPSPVAEYEASAEGARLHAEVRAWNGAPVLRNSAWADAAGWVHRPVPPVSRLDVIVTVTVDALSASPAVDGTYARIDLVGVEPSPTCSSGDAVSTVHYPLTHPRNFAVRNGESLVPGSRTMKMTLVCPGGATLAGMLSLQLAAGATVESRMSAPVSAVATVRLESVELVPA